MNGIILVAGGTGRLGFHVIKELINAGYQVRLLARNFKSAEIVFKEKLSELESVFECDLYEEAKYNREKLENKSEINSVLDLAFQPSQRGQKVQAFISTLGRNLSKNEDSKIIEDVTIKLMIRLCEKNNVDKFILISSSKITQPFSPISLLINFISKDSLAHKVKAENSLRESRLNYIIIRPGGLIGDQSYNQSHSYQIKQGDQESGRISRATVAKIILDVMQSKELSTNVTFECFSEKIQKSLPYENYKFWGDLKQDNGQSFVKVSHFKAKYLVSGIIISIVIMFISLLIK